MREYSIERVCSTSRNNVSRRSRSARSWAGGIAAMAGEIFAPPAGVNCGVLMVGSRSRPYGDTDDADGIGGVSPLGGAGELRRPGGLMGASGALRGEGGSSDSRRPEEPVDGVPAGNAAAGKPVSELRMESRMSAVEERARAGSAACADGELAAGDVLAVATTAPPAAIAMGLLAVALTTPAPPLDDDETACDVFIAGKGPAEARPAPSSSSSAMRVCWPRSVASCSGVCPVLLRTCTLPPSRASNCTVLGALRSAASHNAVTP